MGIMGGGRIGLATGVGRVVDGIWLVRFRGDAVFLVGDLIGDIGSLGTMLNLELLASTSCVASLCRVRRRPSAETRGGATPAPETALDLGARLEGDLTTGAYPSSGATGLLLFFTGEMLATSTSEFSSTMIFRAAAARRDGRVGDTDAITDSDASPGPIDHGFGW